jgi:hypothetical protein
MEKGSQARPIRTRRSKVPSEKSRFLKHRPLNPSEGFIAEQSFFRKARMNKVELFGQMTNFSFYRSGLDVCGPSSRFLLKTRHETSDWSQFSSGREKFIHS